MTNKELLQQRYDNGEVKERDLSFGRVMPFGKYKGKYIFHLLVKHPYYMDWILNNTDFNLNDDETWWKSVIDTALAISRADRLLGALGSFMSTCDMANENNPHYIVE